VLGEISSSMRGRVGEGKLGGKAGRMTYGAWRGEEASRPLGRCRCLCLGRKEGIKDNTQTQKEGPAMEWKDFSSGERGGKTLAKSRSVPHLLNLNCHRARRLPHQNASGEREKKNIWAKEDEKRKRSRRRGNRGEVISRDLSKNKKKLFFLKDKMGREEPLTLVRYQVGELKQKEKVSVRNKRGVLKEVVRAIRLQGGTEKKRSFSRGAFLHRRLGELREENWRRT